MEKEATVEDALLAFLRELYRDTLLHPNFLQATPPDALWNRAMQSLDEKSMRVSEETQRMMTSRLYGERCVGRVNRQDGSYLLQISEEGIAVMRSLEAAIAQGKKEEKEERRWRIGVYIALASLVSGAIGFLAGILVAR